ncbi:MAG: Crp/Fnr family transcriptional regulator [Bacteroidaceae bacterium]
MKTGETNLSMAQRIAHAYALDLSNEAAAALAAIIYPKELARGERFVNEGVVCKHIGYVEKGVVRQFYYKNGKDLTEHISTEDRLFICIESFMKQEPSRFMAEALTPSVVWAIPHDPFYQLVQSQPEISRLYLRILEYSLIESQIKADMFRFETAYDRYERFRKAFPEVAKRAPLQYIASFLQMAPETLSRVRARLC